MARHWRAFLLSASGLSVNVIISAYERLINAIKLRAPHVVMLGHGYDYAIPRIDGPWLGGPMTRQGIDPIDHAELGEAIVRLIIDTFNNRLKALEKSHGNNFKHIDLRGTIKRREWWDELHPFEVGAKKTAAKYLSAIRELPASSEVQEAPFDAYFNRLVA